MIARPEALSVFSGIGGLDLGAAVAGYRVRLATDIDGGALALNRKGTGAAVLEGDIDLLLDGAIQAAWGAGRPRILVGGPPCTAFSHAGFWLDDKREGRDPAAALLASYLKCLQIFRPQGFVLENVPGLKFKTHRVAFDDLVRGAKRLGYSVESEILRATAFSVPQARRRLFVVGVRGDRSPNLTAWPAFPSRSVRWAIGDLEQVGDPEPDELPGKRYRHLLRRIPRGSNYLHLTAERGCPDPKFKYRGRYWSFLLKLHPDRPSPTLPAQRITYNGPFHWTGRHLRIREIARLQGFPDWYPLSQDLAVARRHLGNAVPPLLAAAVVWRVAVTLGDADEAGFPEALAVALQKGATFQQIASAIPQPPSDATAEAPDPRVGLSYLTGVDAA